MKKIAFALLLTLISYSAFSLKNKNKQVKQPALHVNFNVYKNIDCRDFVITNFNNLTTVQTKINKDVLGFIFLYLYTYHSYYKSSDNILYAYLNRQTEYYNFKSYKNEYSELNIDFIDPAAYFLVDIPLTIIGCLL